MSNKKQYPSSISLWRSRSENEKAPVYRGVIQVTEELLEYLQKQFDDANRDEDFVTIEVSIWKNNSEHEKAPLLKGNVEPPRERDNNSDDDDEPRSKKCKSSEPVERKQLSRRSSRTI